jgi:hypothetical protein
MTGVRIGQGGPELVFETLNGNVMIKNRRGENVGQVVLFAAAGMLAAQGLADRDGAVSRSVRAENSKGLAAKRKCERRATRSLSERRIRHERRPARTGNDAPIDNLTMD